MHTALLLGSSIKDIQSVQTDIYCNFLLGIENYNVSLEESKHSTMDDESTTTQVWNIRHFADIYSNLLLKSNVGRRSLPLFPTFVIAS